MTLGMRAGMAIAAAGCIGLFAARTELFPLLNTTTLAGRQQGDFYLTVTSQLLRPWGLTFPIKGRPVEIAFDAQERFVAVLSDRSVLIRDGLTGAPITEVKTRTTSWTGLAFRPR